MHGQGEGWGPVARRALPRRKRFFHAERVPLQDRDLRRSKNTERARVRGCLLAHGRVGESAFLKEDREWVSTPASRSDIATNLAEAACSPRFDRRSGRCNSSITRKANFGEITSATPTGERHPERRHCGGDESFMILHGPHRDTVYVSPGSLESTSRRAVGGCGGG